MNHLAHALLAGAHPDHRLGAFLGDHVKGRLALESWPSEVAAGIRLHRKIDGWSDRHPAVHALKTAVPKYWRRHCGIVFDVLFDTMLVRHWNRFSVQPLHRFGNGLDALLLERDHQLPGRLRKFGAWARYKRLWTRLDDRQLLSEILQLLARRHARPSPLADGLELLDGMDAEIERAFLRMFPDLLEYSGAFLDLEAEERRVSGPG